MIKIPPFENAKVLIVGDVMLDRYLSGSIDRISPEAPVPILKVNKAQERLGGAANVAYNIQKLGGKAIILGITGKDKEAKILSALLQEANIEAYLIEASEPTVQKTRIVSSRQQLIRLDIEEKYTPHPAEILALFKKLITQVDLVILSDYAKGTLSHPQELISWANTKNIPILVDPKANDFSVYKHATFITPNTKEFEIVVGKCANEHEMIEKGTHLLHTQDLSALLVTRGIDGMILLSRNSPPLILKALAQEVFDVTGAGDTVIATLAASLAAGSDMETAAILSNTAAAISVRKHGTSTVSVHELRKELQIQNNANCSILNKNELSAVISAAKAQGEKIVMTNGCFDLLHAGHITYLETARSLGDRLIIAINDDASVSRLKGEKRPINPLIYRMIVLSGLRAVDWVVPFSEDTPADLITLVKPDFLVKGGDYTEDQIAGAKFVRSYGGEVKILPFLSNCSTTSTLNKIQEIQRDLLLENS